MRVFIFRHGDKERSFDGDPNLSLRGKAQAQQLLKLIQSGALPAPNRILSSPLRRAQQTFEPLARSLQVPMELTPELREKELHESSSHFRSRILNFIQKLSDQPLGPKQSLYLVSHMDWLEEVLLLIPSDVDFNLRPVFWATCQYVEFEIRDHLWCYVHSQQIVPPS